MFNLKFTEHTNHFCFISIVLESLIYTKFMPVCYRVCRLARFKTNLEKCMHLVTNITEQ
jgi:hypothetical protein